MVNPLLVYRIAITLPAPWQMSCNPAASGRL